MMQLGLRHRQSIRKSAIERHDGEDLTRGQLPFLCNLESPRLDLDDGGTRRSAAGRAGARSLPQGAAANYRPDHSGFYEVLGVLER